MGGRSRSVQVRISLSSRLHIEVKEERSDHRKPGFVGVVLSAKSVNRNFDAGSVRKRDFFSLLRLDISVVDTLRVDNEFSWDQKISGGCR